MRKKRAALVNLPFNFPAPTAGVDALSPLMAMRENSCVLLENWFARPDGLVSRSGYVNHVISFSAPVKRLHVYSPTGGVDELFATTDLGIFDATTAGSMGAALLVLTEGNCISVSISTGAGSFLMMVNGVDDLSMYDGATWTAVPAFTGPVLTNRYNYVELYRQRLFFAVKDSLEIEYLPVNSIAGAPINYPLGAIFRQGGRIVALGTWTIDGGNGPEDKLAVITSKGEVAVFVGPDPATWSFQGVYYIGQPLGQKCFYKYGGDLLVITESGIRPLSTAVQTASIDRTQTVTQRIKPLITAAANLYGNVDGWELIADPLAPSLVLNIPSSPLVRQAVMHAQTGAWSFFSGMEARCFARFNAKLYFGTTSTVCEIGGVADNGQNITTTMLQAYSQLSYPRNKQIKLVKPYFQSDEGFAYNYGIASDLIPPKELATIDLRSTLGSALWGTGLWGSAIWSGQNKNIQDWQTVPDVYSHWKGIYIRTVSNTAAISYLGSDTRFTLGGDF